MLKFYVTYVSHWCFRRVYLCGMNMKSWLFSYRWSILAGVIGAVVGGMYAYFIGCHSGGCSITSSPVNSSAYGFVMGFLSANIFKTENVQKQ